MVVTSRSLVKSRPQLSTNGVDACLSGGVHPCVNRGERRTAGTHHEKTVHETTDGDCCRCGAPEAAGYFTEGTLDVVDRKCGSPFGIPMKIPRRIMNSQYLELLIESCPADSARPDIKA